MIHIFFRIKKGYFASDFFPPLILFWTFRILRLYQRQPFAYSVSESIQCSPSSRKIFSVRLEKQQMLFHAEWVVELILVATTWWREPSWLDFADGCWCCLQLLGAEGLQLAYCETVGQSLTIQDRSFPDSFLLVSSELDCSHLSREQF